MNVVQQDNSGLEPYITDWDALYEVHTVDLPVPIVKIWVESATGFVRTTRLLAATDETDRASGIQRPRDYSDQNQKVWFAAG